MRRSRRIRGFANSEGAEFDSGRYQLFLATTQGFLGEYTGTSFNLGVAPIAQSDDGSDAAGLLVHRQSPFRTAEDPEAVGLMAAKRALRRLGSRKIKTTRAPVVFDPDMAASLLRSLAGAASGPSLYKGASFLVDKLGRNDRRADT